MATENSAIEEVRSSLIIQGINKRSIRDDMITNALDAFNGDIQQAVEALYQNFQYPNPIMSSSSFSSPTNTGKSIFGMDTTNDDGLSEYERLRQRKVERNEAHLRSLGLLHTSPPPPCRTIEDVDKEGESGDDKDDESEEESYEEDEEYEEESDDDRDDDEYEDELYEEDEEDSDDGDDDSEVEGERKKSKKMATFQKMGEDCT